MKKFLLVLLAAGTLSFGYAQTGTAVPKTADLKEVAAGADPLSINATEYDFGKIPQGKPVETKFEVKNTGTKPLMLINVQASCGCTTPKWSKEPIPPGATSVITVGYNAAASGSFDKPVTITYNDNQRKVLHIKGNVWQAPATSAPENKAVEGFKNGSF